MSRKYGLPFHGLVTTVLEHEAPLGALTKNSRDLIVRPGVRPDGTRVYRRQGTQSLGSTSGVLECLSGDAMMKGLEVFRLSSPSLTDGFPTYGVLFEDEDRFFGQVYLRDANVPLDYVLGEDFSSTHYPTASSTTGEWKVIPLPYNGNGATGYTRLAYEENRRRHCPGTRRHASMRQKDHFPSFEGCPSTWNKRYNPQTAVGSETFRIHPAGHSPPMWAPTSPSASYSGAVAAGTWEMGSAHYRTCFYEYNDGSFGPPFVPRSPNATLTSGFGLVVVYNDGSNTYWNTIPWRNIPVPPGDDVVRVWLARSPSVTRANYASGSRPDISDLRITGFVPAGRTSYDDPNGNDLSLVQDTNIVRFDHKWPERARYAWAFDQRMAYGYLKPNPCAIILAPTGSAASYDRNVAEDANPGSVFFHFRIDTTNLTIKKTSGGATTKVDISLSGKTLQEVVDTINATTTASNSGEWRAAIVPGTSGSTLATYLAPTSQDILCTANASASLSAASGLLAIPEGCKVAGTYMPSGGYVKSRASDVALTLSAVATGSGPTTVTFYSDTGDDSNVADSTYGNIRCYAGSYYGVAALTQAYLDTLGESPQDLTFTAGGTTHARSAPESFYTSVGNRRSALFGDEAGVLQGGAALNDGCVVFYSRHIYWLHNTRAGGTGEDADYQMTVLELGRGCISPYSIVQGNGWVGCLTNDGFWAFDGTRTVLISGDVLDKDHDGGYVGEWSYEAGQCSDAAEADTNDYGFFAGFSDGILWVNYRVDASNCAYLSYNCSPSIESSGVAQLLRPDGSLYGWSPRCRYSWRGETASVSGAIGFVRTAAGKLIVACDNTNDKTYGGLIQQIEVPGVYNDGGEPVLCYGWLVMDMCGSLKKKSLRSARILYGLTDASDELTVVVYPCLSGSVASTYSRALSKTGAGLYFSRKEIPFDIAASSGTDSIQWFFGVTAATGDGGEFWAAGIESEVAVLNSYD